MEGHTEAPALAALHQFNDGLVRRLFLRVPFATHGSLHVVCRRFKTLLRSREFLQQRVDSGLAEYGLCTTERSTSRTARREP